MGAADSPRVSRAALSILEKNLDDKIRTLWDDTPLALVGQTRGIYLDGYGAVFTAEVLPVSGPIALFHGPTYTKEEIARYHKKRADRMPQLKTEMKQFLVKSAAALDSVPVDEQIVLSVVLDHNLWEDVSATPAQVMVQSSKRKLLDAQKAGSGSAAMLDQAIRVSEF
jgi:hypothetical protein